MQCWPDTVTGHPVGQSDILPQELHVVVQGPECTTYDAKTVARDALTELSAAISLWRSKVDAQDG
jgi:hypothetical protein